MLNWQRLLKSLALAVLFAAGVLAVGLLIPVCGLLGARRRRTVRDKIAMAWCRTAARVLGLRVQTLGQPLAHGVWAANHVSWLDVITLAGRQPLCFVAKREVAAWPVVGYLARQIGTLFVDRGNAAANRKVADAMTHRLRQRETLVLFPEGTTTSGDRVLRFHARLFKPALAANAPVQPVAIAYQGAAAGKVPFIGDDEFLSHLWALLAEPEIAAVVHYGNAVTGAATRDHLARTTRHDIAVRLGFATLTSNHI